MERFSRRKLFRVAAEPMVGVVVFGGVALVALTDRQWNVEPSIKQVNEEIGMPSEGELAVARGVIIEPMRHTREEVSRAVDLQFNARNLASTQRKLLEERGVWNRKANGELAGVVGLIGLAVSAFRAGP